MYIARYYLQIALAIFMYLQIISKSEDAMLISSSGSPSIEKWISY